MERLETALDQALGTLGLRESSRRHLALRYWGDIVGSQLLAHSRAAALRGTTLEVVVSDSIWANQLAFMKSDLLERLNLRIGENAIEDLRVRVGPIPAAVATTEGQDLRPDEIRLAEAEARKGLGNGGPKQGDVHEALVSFMARVMARQARRQRR